MSSTLPRATLAYPAAVLALVATLGAVSPCRADAVSPGPVGCPDGSEPVACHGPATCRARSCTSDVDCSGGARCVEASFCRADHPCGGLLPEPVHVHLEAECDPGHDTCTAPARCEVLRVCRGGAAAATEAPVPGAPALATSEAEPTPAWLIWSGVGGATMIAVLVALWMTRNKRAAPML